VDPFGVTCDPRLYVPRLGTEAALTALRSGLAEGRAVCVLSGPPGLGKTTVLHALAREPMALRFAYLPYAALDAEDLAAIALDRLGAPAPRGAAQGALTTLARDSARPIVLLVDDASALPIPTARVLRELARAAAGQLRLVCALVDDPRASSVAAALGDDVLHVRLLHSLTEKEVRTYLHGRIDRAGAARTCGLHDAQIAWIAAESGGVPRRINQMADALLRRSLHEAVMPALESECEVRGALASGCRERAVAERARDEGPAAETIDGGRSRARRCEAVRDDEPAARPDWHASVSATQEETSPTMPKPVDRAAARDPGAPLAPDDLPATPPKRRRRRLGRYGRRFSEGWR
jgi:type II secretory pathway predicted ATPase ExeA